MYYYIFEVQNRADGIDNILTPVQRQSLATGLSYFYDRCSKMAGTTLYPSVTILLMDSEGKVYENKHLTTAWTPEEPSEEE